MLPVSGLETGAQLRELSLRLAATGNVGVKRQMQLAFLAATKPAKGAVRASALGTLPQGGGANQVIAAKKITSSTVTGPRTAGVRLKMKKQSAVNRGRLRHPRFGDRDYWYTTQVTPGFWSKPLEAMRPQVAAACGVAMELAAIEAGFRPY